MGRYHVVINHILIGYSQSMPVGGGNNSTTDVQNMHSHY